MPGVWAAVSQSENAATADGLQGYGNMENRIQVGWKLNLLKINMTTKEMKEIVLPEGFEVDFENSTKDKVILKAVERKLPEKIEDLKKCKHYYDDGSSTEMLYGPYDSSGLVSVKQAKSSNAQRLLGFLMKEYNGDWEPDWADSYKTKYCIIRIMNYIHLVNMGSEYKYLSFRTPELRDKFFSHFERLIKDYFELD